MNFCLLTVIVEILPVCLMFLSKFYQNCNLDFVLYIIKVPDHLEPGLDDKQLTRLLGLDLQGAERTPDPPERPRKRAGLTDLSREEVQQQLEKQKESSKWHNLVEGNLILKQGLVDKRKVRSQLNTFTLFLARLYCLSLCAEA